MNHTKKQLEPGVYRGLPFEEYVAIDALNNSAISKAVGIDGTMRKLRHYMLYGGKEPTKNMRFGSLVHAGLLEPKAFAEKTVVMPDLTEGIVRKDGTPYDNPKATKEYKARVAQFEADNAGKTVVDRGDYFSMKAMFESLWSVPRVADLLSQPGDSEVTLVWDDEETGVRLKARVDYLAEQPTDLKSCRSASVIGFGRSVQDFGYYRQCPLYTMGYRSLGVAEKPLVFIACESDEPYDCAVRKINDDLFAHGMEEVRYVINRYAECLRTGVWPGYEDPAPMREEEAIEF